MKEVVVLSKSNAKLFKCDRPWACISISTYWADLPVLDKENRLGLLQLYFRDTTNTDHERHFTGEQAREVLEFVKEFWDKTEVFMIHCEAGLSRSAGVAAAIVHIKEGKDAAAVYFQGKFWANYLVYKTILETEFGQIVPHHSQRQADTDDVLECWEL